MSTTAHTAHRTRRASIATVAAVIVGLSGPIGATSSAAAPPPDGSTVELAPGLSQLDDVLITDTAVYFTDTPGDATAIYRRSLTTDASGTALGPAEVVGVGVVDGAIAEHNGTLAYTRATDGRLVLRAADGTITTPAWGASSDFASGVVALSDDWLVVQSAPRSDDGVLRLYDRSSGSSYDLRQLFELPGEVRFETPLQVRLDDDRLMWFFLASLRVQADLPWFYGVYTVGLGEDGPQGDVVTLGSSMAVAGAQPRSSLATVDLEGTRVMWYRQDCSQTCVNSILWYDDAPYTGTPQSVALDGLPLAADGNTVTVLRRNVPTSTVEWVDLGDPSTPVLSIDTRAWVRAVSGTLVAHQDSQGRLALSDAAGGAVTIDPTPVPRLPFVDMDWSSPFIQDVMWLAGTGITTGWPDGTFRPTATITRQAMAAFLYRTTHDGADAPACTVAPFTDVAATDPFCGEITWLAATGITTGWPDGTFRPTQPVSREAMAAFLYRLANDDADAPACTTAPFTDVAITDPFCGEITWLAGTGITTGWPDGTFHPTAAVSRQAMAAFLFRFVDAGLVPAG